MRVRVTRLRLLWRRHSDPDMIFIGVARDSNRSDVLRAYCSLANVEVSINITCQRIMLTHYVNTLYLEIDSEYAEQ